MAIRLSSGLGLLVLLICQPVPAHAGRNANGALVVHTTPENIYRFPNFCETATPTVCEELNPTSQDGIDTATVIWFMAAFRPEASPAVTAIQFGIDHNLPAGQGYFVRYSSCGPSPLELPDTGWPETGFGNLVAYSGPVNDHVFKYYYFIVFHDNDQNYLGTRTYPSTNEAKFVDDGSPPVEDLIFNFGTVRWEVPGDNACPPSEDYCTCCLPDGVCLVHLPTDDCFAQGGMCLDPNTVCDPNPCPQPEACCYEDGRCEMLLAADCTQAGGVAQGPGTNCDPNLCVEGETGGACCFDDGHCEFVAREYCEEVGGDFQGVWTICEFVQCETTPVLKTTWGDVKVRFR